jgi:hypothetical protein
VCHKIEGLSIAEWRTSALIIVNILLQLGWFALSALDTVQEVQLRVQLRILEKEHRELDEQIAKLEMDGTSDQLHLRRLKKTKLSLRDRIARIEAMIIPDIIA